MKFLVEKRNGLFDLKTLYRWFSGVADGYYQIEAKILRKQRTNDQNAWLWGCIYPMMLDGLIEAGWEFTDVEQVHEFFKAQMTAERVINKHTGEVVHIPESTARMDTTTFSVYCEKLREYASDFLGIEIPDPDKFWIEKETKNK